MDMLVDKNYHEHLGFQEKEVLKWAATQAQSSYMYSWGNANMGSELLGDICSSCQLGERANSTLGGKDT